MTESISSVDNHVQLRDSIPLPGRKSFHVLVIRTWNERLDHLTKENHYLDALALGCEFFRDQGKTLVGLKGPKEKRKTVIAQKLISILLKFLDVAMTSNFPLEGNMAVLSNYFEEIVPPCVNACMTVKRRDLLFENVWQTYALDPFAKAAYLESLEAFILSDQLRNLPVSITQEFVNHYETVSRLEALEACLTHINVASLDIHQVMNVCWLHGLYDAIIYVYNNGMLDYVAPAEELLGVLTGAMANPSLAQNQIDLGNKILVYVSCCLAGRAYPYGEVPADRKAKVKYDVYNCLTALHTKRPKDDELAYPYLRTLLRFDAQGLLNVVAIAFEEPEFNTENGRCQKQRLVDSIEKIVCEEEGFSATQRGYLFTFIARQIAKGDNVFDPSRDLFDKFLDVLTETSYDSPSDQTASSHHEERQQALLELINAGGLKYFDREKLVLRSEAVGFFKILETLYEDSREYDKVLQSIISDVPRRVQAFAYVQKVLLEDSYDNGAKAAIEKAFMKQLDALVAVDVKKTAMVVFYHMPSYTPLVIANLEERRESLYHFLRHAIEYKDRGGGSSSAENLGSRKAEQEIEKDQTFEKFVDLMCEFEPRKVASLLKSRHSTYNADAMLKICRKRGGEEVTDAIAFLLEAEGRSVEAFELLKQSLDARLVKVKEVDADDGLFWSQVNASVVILVQVCQRAASADGARDSPLTQEGMEALWFQLLDSLLVPQRLMEKPAPALKEVVRHVVNSAIGYIPLRSVIEKILQDPVYQSGSFGDVKDFLVEMMEMYHYEETLLKSTITLVRDDVHGQLLKRQAGARRGISSRDLGCDQCAEHVALKGGRCVVFQCGHKYHMPCLAMAGCVVVSELGEESWHCYKCVTKRNRGTEELTRQSESAAPPPGPSVASERPAVGLGDRDLAQITDQKLVQAKAYLDGLRLSKPPLTMMEDMSRKKEEAKQDGVHIEGAPDDGNVSIFDRPDFALKLWSGR